ncbi:MAG: hypothetical protein ACJAWV_000223 [Flammeovirgaceae bacterium]|jgi:hypothetical protein
MKKFEKFAGKKMSKGEMKSVKGGSCITNTAARDLKHILDVPEGHTLRNVSYDANGCFVYADIVPE